MLVQKADLADDKGRFKETLETAGNYAADALDVERLKKKVENAVEDAVLDARRLARKGRYAVEDVMDDAAYRIKKDPLRSVGYGFGAGLGLGVLTGWLLTRRNREH